MSTPTPTPTKGSPGLGALSSAISDAVTAITRRFTGRGPTETRTIIDGDAVVVIMRNVLNHSETAHTHLDAGSMHHVMALQSSYRAAIRPGIVEEVQRLTDRKVRAFMSAGHAHPDYATEVFILDRPAKGDRVPERAQGG